MQACTTIELLRHGETTAGSCFLGSTDAPLSDLGWQQMQAVTNHKKYNHIISSPLKRCADFAKQLTQKNNSALTIEDDLREIHFGDWETKTTEELWKTQQNELKTYWGDPISYTPPNAESFMDFQLRVNSVFKEITKKYKDERILLVVHAGVIRQIISFVLSIPFTKTQQMHIDHGGLARVVCYDDNMSLGFINLKAENI